MRSPLIPLAVLLLLLLVCAAPPAHAQQTTTRPVGATLVDDPSKDVPLPARQGGATTQATLAGGAATSSGDVFDVKRLGFALAVVLGAMYVTHQVWKRLGMPGSANRAAGSLQVLSRLNLSPRQQLVLVRVGRRVVLVGNSGTQMNALCEIGDPEEAGELLGLAATERDESASATFSTVLGGEEKRFDEQSNIDLQAPGDGEVAAEEQALTSTRDELSDMMDKVRSLSRQFRPSTKGE
jgi:flagellar biogenesis protein FliO